MIDKHSFYKKVGPFIVFSSLIVLVGVLQRLYIDKGDLVWWFNLHQSSGLNFMFHFFSQLVEGYGLITIFLALLFYQKWAAVLLLLNYGISGLLVQILKNFVFVNYPRPVMYFQQHHNALQLLDGLDYHNWHSFPSGHTASAMAICLTILIATHLKPIGILIVSSIAILVGISRVYLAQHFLEDVLAGALIGVWSSIIVSWFWLVVYKADEKVQLKGSILGRHAHTG